MTIFNEAELIRQLEEQRAVIVQSEFVIHLLRREVAMLTAALKKIPPSSAGSDYLGKKK